MKISKIKKQKHYNGKNKIKLKKYFFLLKDNNLQFLSIILILNPFFLQENSIILNQYGLLNLEK
jgi:hypothetical protein